MDDRTTEAIWRACGSMGPLRLGVTPPRPGSVRVVPHPFAVIGRDSRCEIALDNEAISRRHALLLVLEGRLFGIDLGSREGTLWANTARAYGWLEGDATLTLGPYQVQTLHPGPVGSVATFNPMASWPSGPQNGAGLILEVVNLPKRKSRWRIKSVVTLIGRSPDCKMRLMDPSVSSVHCCLVCTPMGLWVIDLLGREGIEVNERPVQFARLADSDDLRVGRFLFRVRGEVALPKSFENRSLPGTSLAVPSLHWQEGTGSADSGAGAGSLLPALNTQAGQSFPLSTTRTESAESVLVPVVNALRMLQKHDQDQHHQTMMMLQTIFALHGEQISSVRSQLDSVLQLLQEVRSSPLDPVLAARLAETAKARELPSPRELPGTRREPNPSAHAPAPPPDPSSQVYRLPSARFAETSDRAGSSPSPRPASAPPSRVSPRQAKAQPQPAAPNGTPATKAARSAPALPSEGIGKPKSGQEPQPPLDKDPTTNPEHSLFEDGMHSMIRDRLHDLRRERMTLWQKIIDMVGGS